MNEVVLSIMFAFSSVWNMKDIEYLKTETYAIYISAAVHSFPTQETGALLIDVTTLMSWVLHAVGPSRVP